MTKDNTISRKWIFRIAALIIVVIVAVIMFIIGRGHTVYFDNVSVDYNGKALTTPYKINVLVDGEQVCKLYEKERGVTNTMGQNFSMQLEVTDQKNGNERIVDFSMKLPYGMDGIILNIPAILEGAPEEVYLTEFIPSASEEEAEDEEVVIDEFEMPMEEESSDEEG